MRSEAVSFGSPSGGVLSGVHYTPLQGTPVGHAILADRLDDEGAALAAELAHAGIAVLRIDLTDTEDTAPATVENVLAAARYLGESDASAGILIGHGTGASAVLLAAASLPDVAGVVTLDTIDSPAGQPFRGEENGSDIALLALGNMPGPAGAARAIAAWTEAVVQGPEPASLEELEGGQAVVAEVERTYRTDIAAGGHTLVVDEPIAVGGTDMGPTPYDLIAAALGACTAITLRMYADRKEWPLESVSVSVHHTRIHAVDEEHCEDDERARLDHLQRTVVLHGALNDEQRSSLLEIADRCPVHRTLDQGMHIDSNLADEL